MDSFHLEGDAVWVVIRGVWSSHWQPAPSGAPAVPRGLSSISGANEACTRVKQGALFTESPRVLFKRDTL